MIKKLLAAVLILLSCQCIGAQKSALKNMPQGYTPEEVGRRMAYRFVTEKHNLHLGKWIGYPETFYWNGSIRYAHLTGDKSLMTLLQRRFEHLFNEESALLPIMNHVDVNMFGSLPLWLYEVTGDTRYKDLGMPYADSQWECPENASESQKAWADKGYSWQTRLWIDDMYMIPVVRVGILFLWLSSFCFVEGLLSCLF